MAVSQHLRPGGLIDAVRNYFTPDVVRKASSLVGESESSTQSTLNGAVPSVLSGMVNMVSSREGTTSLSGLIRDGGYGAVAEDASSLFSGGSATNNMLSAGTQLLGKFFGNKSSSVADVVGRAGGVSSNSAMKLMSLVAPLALGVLGKRAASHGMGFAGVAKELLDQKSEIAAASPTGLSQMLSPGPTPVRSEAATGPDLATPRPAERSVEHEYLEEPRERRTGGLAWLPLLLIALAALGLFLFLRGRTSRARDLTAQGIQMARIDLPGGVSLSVPKGSINDNLATFLADRSAGNLPKTFVFDNLNFQSASTQLTPESVTTVNNLAQILKAYPNARVELAGHTDNTGTAEANQQLSSDRANAVKGLLVGQGVAADKLTANGYGQTRPVASNDSEDGRAHNRRIELNVVSK